MVRQKAFQVKFAAVEKSTADITAGGAIESYASVVGSAASLELSSALA